MVAGLLAKSGYDMGKRLHRPVESNPKGFFESPGINRINDALIRGVVGHRPLLLGRWLRPRALGRTHMWMARVPLGAKIAASKRLGMRIGRTIPDRPFCFKDPRFSYTLHVWRPYLRDAVFVCVFRDPAVTVDSLLRECRRPRYRGIEMDAAVGFEIVTLMYRHILELHSCSGAWLFLHYEQVLGGEGIELLERHLGAPVDRGFPEASLRRSKPVGSSPRGALEVYQTLCDRANYVPSAK